MQDDKVVNIDLLSVKIVISMEVNLINKLRSCDIIRKNTWD